MLDPTQILFNPNSMGVKYSSIVLKGGGDKPCLCFDLFIGQQVFFLF